MKRSKRVLRVVVTADGAGVVSHAGVGLLREMAEYTGLNETLTAALTDTYRGPWLNAPGRVFTDLAVAVADGAHSISGIAVLGDRQDLHCPVASMPTTWRVLDRIDDSHLGAVRTARAAARAAALPAHAHPVLDPDTGTWAGPRLLARSDSAVATHAFAAACVERGVEFSFGFPVDARIQRIVDVIPEACWHPARQTPDRHGNEFRDGAWVAEATGMIDLTGWPEGSRLILRKERPHPSAQLTFTDVDGHRVTAILTNTGAGLLPGQAAGLELRHRQHARVEDRIRQAKATGLRNLPCHGFTANAAWLQAVLTAVDLVAWTKKICFADTPELARCEIHAFRYRILHVAARITRGARQIRLRIDKTWRWATHITEGFT